MYIQQLSESMHFILIDIQGFFTHPFDTLYFLFYVHKNLSKSKEQ